MPTPGSIFNKGTSKLKSILGRVSCRGQKKKVHWDSTVQDNEFKSKPRRKAIAPNKKTPSAAKVMATQMAVQQTAPASKQDSSDIGLPHSKANMQGSHIYRSPSPHPTSRTSWNALNSQAQSSTPGPTEKAIQSPTVAGPNIGNHPIQGPGRPITTPHSTHHQSKFYAPTTGSASTSQPQRTYRPKTAGRNVAKPERRLTQANKPTKVPTYRPQQAVPSQARPRQSTVQQPSSSNVPNRPNNVMQRPGKPQVLASANTGVKRVSNPTAQRLSARDPGQRNVTSERVPPAVPNAPRGNMGMRGGLLVPPPTPRPERLPTPDLPEMGGESFCDCDACVPGHPNRNRATGRSNETSDLDVTVRKTNLQIQAAWAYIQDSRSGKK